MRIGIALVIVGLGITLATLVLGELVPKRLALYRAEQLAAFVASADDDSVEIRPAGRVADEFGDQRRADARQRRRSKRADGVGRRHRAPDRHGHGRGSAGAAREEGGRRGVAAGRADGPRHHAAAD